jgi:Mlc titration factor MtfA (ptsG expression regulator)
MQVANAFMTLIANSDQQINKIANGNLKVFLADSIVSEGERVAGYFSTANHMVLSRDPGFATFNATAVHELTHVLDHSDGSLDGYINGLSPDWSRLRDNAEQKIASTNGNFSGLESGFVNYSTTNDMEFLAVMSQLYQSDTNDFQRNFPELFNTLDRMFRVA